ncbi:hypothetical protein [Cupriavidus basilensis]|uniref:hypothetical protein n=1 Tax=Cupriavidus basilensis TaxID=68895 RepID=UPI00114707FA|nr:hypothetical protein [Cupriavidus basilensis]
MAQLQDVGTAANGPDPPVAGAVGARRSAEEAQIIRRRRESCWQPYNVLTVMPLFKTYLDLDGVKALYDADEFVTKRGDGRKIFDQTNLNCQSQPATTLRYLASHVAQGACSTGSAECLRGPASMH